MKKIITESTVREIIRKGEPGIFVSKQDIITPAAIDLIRAHKLTIIKSEEITTISSSEKKDSQLLFRKGAIGSDHTGFQVKNLIIKILQEKGITSVDVGTYDEKSCDYPDFAYSVAKKVRSKEVDFGIIIDATGIPSSITANKIRGIRAATCYNEFSAKSCREHNNANILVLGAKSLGEETIKSILEVWLNTEFAGGRHQKRLDKISNIEEQESLK
jgi:ribose 5-phosphate isomerase B